MSSMYSVGGNRVAFPYVSFCLRVGLSCTLQVTPSCIAFDMVDVKHAMSIRDVHDPLSGLVVCLSGWWLSFPVGSCESISLLGGECGVFGVCVTPVM